jgi:hypothetical protein
MRLDGFFGSKKLQISLLSIFGIQFVVGEAKEPIELIFPFKNVLNQIIDDGSARMSPSRADKLTDADYETGLSCLRQSDARAKCNW